MIGNVLRLSKKLKVEMLR